MSSDNAAPCLLPDSGSPEVMTTSCSLPIATPSIPPSGDTLMSLLLQIQHYHSSELHKLHDQVGRWKMKCNKLAKTSNDNASVAKKCLKQNSLLQAQVIELKCQLRVLQSPRQDSLLDASKIQASPPDQASPKEETAQTNQVEDLTKKTFKAANKLTSKKSNKKVRYSEMSTNEGLQKQAVETTTLTRFPEQIMPSVVPSMSNETVLKDPSRLLNLKKIANRSPGGIILAPDTCISPTAQAFRWNAGSGAMPVGHINSMHTPDGYAQRIRGPRVHAVPETLGVDDDIVTSLELNDASLMDAPTYASTPVGSHSQMSLSSDSVQIHDPKTFQIPKSTRRSLKIASSDSPSGQVLLTSPMPKSESQYPVDLSSTQVKSPTFCGEGLTPGSANNQSRQRGTSDVGWTVPSPNAGEKSDLYATDESYESEASMLLLGPNVQKKRAANPHPSQNLQNQAGMSEKVTVSTESFKVDQAIRCNENIPSHQSGSRTSKTCAIAPRNIKQERTVEYTMPLQLPANLSWVSASKKRKLDVEDSTSYDETVFPDAASPGEENSPEGLDYPTSLASSNQHPNPRQVKKENIHVHEPAPEHSGDVKVKCKGSKSLKQSKLSLNMFIKPGMNKSASLMRKYNGGSLVNVDSQSDAFMNRAIELSRIDQKGAEARGKDKPRSEYIPAGSEVIAGFKVPTVPHKKQQRCNTETSLTERRALQHPTEQNVPELPLSLSEVLLFTNSLHDPNGSIDPLMDLTRIESGTSPCNKPPNQFVAGGSHDMKHVEGGMITANRKSGPSSVDWMQLQTANDSCQDLFDEEEESEEEIDPSAGRDRTRFIDNFDKVPQMDDKPNYKYTEVVRKHKDRQKLKGFGCKECDQFYGDLPLTDAQREERMKICSRHRAQFSPPHTPDHYWSVGFPDTQTCLERGYIKESRSPDKRTRKRKNKYRKLFGKEVDDAREEDDDARQEDDDARQEDGDSDS